MPNGLIGSIAPDMIHGPLPSGLHDEIAAAAREHYQVDRFTDAHPAFARTRDRLRHVVEPKLAGILADVLYDHVLARDWTDWHSEALVDYLDQTHQSLITALPHVPVRMQVIVRKMIDEQWLASYATVAGIRARLKTMSQRLTRRLDRPLSLEISECDLAEHAPSLTDDFNQLWPDLIVHVQQCRIDAQTRLAS